MNCGSQTTIKQAGRAAGAARPAGKAEQARSQPTGELLIYNTVESHRK